MYSQTLQTIDRRQKTDPLLRSISLCGFAGWCIAITAMILLHVARPPLQTVATRSANVFVRTGWAEDLIRLLVYVLFAGLCISTTGLLVNTRRLKRAGDSIRINLILTWSVSLLGLVLCLTLL